MFPEGFRHKDHVQGRGTGMDDVLDRAVIILEKAESFIVPIKWLWKMLNIEFPQFNLTVELVTDNLKRDSRFKLFSEESLEIDIRTRSLLPDDDLESLGFYRGARVMLKSRIPTRHEVISFLLKKADQTFETLKKAWDIRPEGDEHTEDQLLEALAKAQKLQRELRAILMKEEENKAESWRSDHLSEA